MGVITGHPRATEADGMATARISSDGLVGPAARLVDEMFASYVDWREDADAVSDAYTRWSDAPRGERAWRFSAYLAALEQEQSAAKTYALAITDVVRSLHP